MNAEGERFALEYTRKCIKDAINSNIPAIDTSNEISDILEECLRG